MTNKEIYAEAKNEDRSLAIYTADLIIAELERENTDLRSRMTELAQSLALATSDHEGMHETIQTILRAAREAE